MTTGRMVMMRSVVFLPCDHGLDFQHQLFYVILQSINIVARILFRQELYAAKHFFYQCYTLPSTFILRKWYVAKHFYCEHLPCKGINVLWSERVS